MVALFSSPALRCALPWTAVIRPHGFRLLCIVRPMTNVVSLVPTRNRCFIKFWVNRPFKQTFSSKILTLPCRLNSRYFGICSSVGRLNSVNCANSVNCELCLYLLLTVEVRTVRTADISKLKLCYGTSAVGVLHARCRCHHHSTVSSFCLLSSHIHALLLNCHFRPRRFEPAWNYLSIFLLIL